MWLEEFQLWMASMIFTKQDRLASMISSSHEILWSVLCKKWGFSGKPPLFFIFILDQFHAKLTQKCLCFSEFFGIKKLNWLMVSWDETGIKLWNRQIRSGKKIETDSTRLRRGCQLLFFPEPILDGFRFNSKTTVSFIFEPKNRKNPNIFRQFHVKLVTKKKVRLIPKSCSTSNPPKST